MSFTLLGILNSQAAAAQVLEIEYLIIAGGGGGGGSEGGAGGAGGYRSSVIGESSGGGASAETLLPVTYGEDFTVTIGAGSSGTGSNSSVITSDPASKSVTSLGGGRGANRRGTPEDGGSGGGASPGDDSASGVIGFGTTGQGFDGGLDELVSGSYAAGGGGGGAGGDGGDYSVNQGDGGLGVTSSITGSAVGRAGGGGGGSRNGAGTATDGGGAGATSGAGESGTANTGGGGGGSGQNGAIRTNGGSGVVIFRYPSSADITIGAGLVATTTTVGDNKVTTITGGTGNVSWAA